MAKKAKKKQAARAKSESVPRFPYTNSPGALRKLLTAIPAKPRPSKLTLEMMKTWKVTSTNEASPLRVLKDIGLLSANGEPQAAYNAYMEPPPKGPRALGARLKEVYKELFEVSHEPHKNQSDLNSFFRINAGGGERTIEYQIQTFKALSEYADFSGTGDPAAGAAGDTGEAGNGGGGNLPSVKIDLHIHLPENKTTRDYESIIQDIARYIYGRNVGDRG